MGKSTISRAIFNSYVSHYQRVNSQWQSQRAGWSFDPPRPVLPWSSKRSQWCFPHHAASIDPLDLGESESAVLTSTMRIWGWVFCKAFMVRLGWCMIGFTKLWYYVYCIYIYNIYLFCWPFLSVLVSTMFQPLIGNDYWTEPTWTNTPGIVPLVLECLPHFTTWIVLSGAVNATAPHIVLWEHDAIWCVVSAARHLITYGMTWPAGLLAVPLLYHLKNKIDACAQ